MHTLHLRDLIAPDAPPVRVMAAYHTSANRHDHDFFEMVYVTDGFCLQDAAGSVSLLMEGDLFILKPGREPQVHGQPGSSVASTTASFGRTRWASAFSESLRDAARPVTGCSAAILSLRPAHARAPVACPSERSAVTQAAREHVSQEYARRQPTGWHVRLAGQLLRRCCWSHAIAGASASIVWRGVHGKRACTRPT